MIKIITLKYNPILDKIDETEFEDFIKDKEVISVKDHFFIKNNTPYLLLIIDYNPGRVNMDHGKVSKNKKNTDEAWKKIIPESDYPLFNSMRDWRLKRAKQQGIPPFVICNNKQLAEIVALRPATLSDFARVNGIGEKIIEQYGKEMLSFFKPHESGKKHEPAQQDLFKTDEVMNCRGTGKDACST